MVARFLAGLKRSLLVTACAGSCGCYSLGATRLYEDQLQYTRALGDAEKSATLLNVVRVRYGDPPTFLQATQVISGYQIMRNVNGGFEAFPAAGASSFLSGGAAAQFQQSPTFTFQPLSGEQFAKSFIRPLAPGDLLPLAMSGLPIDVLFRLGVQSANDLSNAVALTETGAAGSPDFFLLLHDLRRLQIAGLLTIRLPQDAAAPAGPSPAPSSRPALPPELSPSENPPDAHEPEPSGTQSSAGAAHIFLSLAPTRDPSLADTADEAKRLLGMPALSNQAEVVYGRSPAPGQVAILTRSMLGVLSQLAIQIEVPPEDVRRHRTLQTVGNIGPERRPVVIIHCGPALPDDVFTSIRYHGNYFWIAQDDFDSKLAFSVLQILLALARTQNAPGAVLTIPAG